MRLHRAGAGQTRCLDQKGQEGRQDAQGNARKSRQGLEMHFNVCLAHRRRDRQGKDTDSTFLALLASHSASLRAGFGERGSWSRPKGRAAFLRVLCGGGEAAGHEGWQGVKSAKGQLQSPTRGALPSVLCRLSSVVRFLSSALVPAIQ